MKLNNYYISRFRNSITKLLTFIWYSMRTDIYTQYRLYIKEELINKSNSELRIIH